MKVVTTHRSPNFSQAAITVRGVVIHYTATTLPRTLEILLDPARQVSAHIVIDLDGTVYELLDCLFAPAVRGWHAGVSRGKFPNSVGELEEVESFNDFSVGIEVVNVNGNVFAYSEAQYCSLIEVLNSLTSRYPEIRSPLHIVGHEEIAGFRGKIDPGRLFNWNRVFEGVFSGVSTPEKLSICPEKAIEPLRRVYQALEVGVDAATGCAVGRGLDHPQNFESLNALLEAFSHG